MGRHCVVYGCTNSSERGVSVHQFPQNAQQFQAWIRFVNVRRANFKTPSDKRRTHSGICQNHFAPDCYNQVKLKLLEANAIKGIRTLESGAIPTIQAPQEMEGESDTTDRSPVPRPKRSRKAVDKLLVARVSIIYVSQNVTIVHIKLEITGSHK